MRTLLSLIGFTLIAPLQARSECPILIEGLEGKMSAYREYREINQIQQQKLLAAATACEVRGADLSGQISRAAAGLTCQALADAKRLNQEISELGEACEKTFFELQQLQSELRVSFRASKDDLDEGMKILQGSRPTRIHCAEELRAARKMTDAFILLESGISAVAASATSGTKDFSSLRRAGAAIATIAAASNENCGGSGLASGEGPAPHRRVGSTYGQGAGRATAGGKSPHPASDITGSNKALADEALSESIIGNQK